MRSAHLNSEEIAAYHNRSLSAEAALEISDHLVACVECRDQIRRAEAKPDRAPTVTYEELAGYIDNQLDPIARQEVTRKLSLSPPARRELRDLMQFKNSLAAEEESFHFQKWLLPIAAGILLAAGIGWWSATARHTEVAKDGNGLSPELQTTMNDALARDHFALPSKVEELRHGRERLAGQVTRVSTGLKLISPVATAVETEKPVFRWTRIEGTTAYRINLAPRDNDAAVETFVVPAGQTTWSPSKPLARGQIYEWEVQAVRNNETIDQAPAPPEPEALFYVLNQQEREAVARERQKLHPSHLALGLIDARAGLIDAARDEFRALQNEDPESDLPRKLAHALENSRVLE